jgi:hypothetical protein
VNVDGQPAPLESDRWAFRPDGTFAISSGGKEGSVGPYTRDPGETPGSLDLARPAAKGLPILVRARYRLAGDTLTVSVGHGPTGRPTWTRARG